MFVAKQVDFGSNNRCPYMGEGLSFPWNDVISESTISVLFPGGVHYPERVVRCGGWRPFS